MKKKLLILLTLILFTPFVVNAYEIKTDWYKNWGGVSSDGFYFITSTKDGGFVVVGNSASTDIEGITNKGNEDAIIVKYDKNWNVLWQKSWGGNKDDYFHSVITTEDDGFIVNGYSASTDIEGITNKGKEDAIIVKYDKDGNMVWKKSWGGSGNDRFQLIKSTEDDGFVVVGYSGSTDVEGITNKGGLADAIIVKYDKDGNVLWQNSFGRKSDDRFHSITTTKDGGFIVVGYSSVTTEFNHYDCIIVKYDKNGNMIWQKDYGGSGMDYFYSVTTTEDDAVIVVGSILSQNIEGITYADGSDSIIVKYDKNGNMIWQKTWGVEGTDMFDLIASTEDGGFIAVGTISKGTDIEGITYKGGYIDTIIVKFDKDWNMLWKDNPGGNNIDDIRSVITTEDGEIIAVGMINSSDIDGITNKGSSDAIILKYSIEYDLEMADMENGTANVEQKGKNGIITPTPNEGYEVSEIVIKDKNGNVLDLEVTKLEDGTYSFELNDDVTVEVLFKEKLENPKTGMSNIIGLMFTIALCFISGFFVLKNYNKNYEL